MREGLVKTSRVVRNGERPKHLVSAQNTWKPQNKNGQTCPEKHLLDTIGSKATENLIPLSDSFESISSFGDPTFAKLDLITTPILKLEDLDLDPLAYILHKVVKVVIKNGVLDLKPPRGPPTELNRTEWVRIMMGGGPGENAPVQSDPEKGWQRLPP